VNNFKKIGCVLLSLILLLSVFSFAPKDVNAAESGLLGYESFDYTAGVILHGLDGGVGWNGGWAVQAGNTDPSGYRVEGVKPLTYSTLETSTNYMEGGIAYLGASRKLDVSKTGAFKDYLTSDGKNIGKPGTTIWASMLVRKNLNNDELLRLNFGGGNNILFGFLGDKNGGNRYWSLKVGGEQKVSDVSIVAGQTSLVVFKLEFGGNSKVSMFIDPLTLGGEAPEEPEISIETSASIAFQSFGAILSQAGLNHGSLDQIRFGTSYGSVTPAAEDHVPPAAPINIRSLNQTTSSITLAWEPSTDNIGVAGYKIYQGTDLIAITRNTTFTVENLQMSTGYTFHVTVIDAASNESAESDSLSAATLGPVDVFVSVDKRVQYQMIEGFGGAAIYKGYFRDKDTAFTDMLIEDLGLTIARLDVPTSFEIIPYEGDRSPHQLDLTDPNWNVDGHLNAAYSEAKYGAGSPLQEQINFINKLKQSADAKGAPIKFISSVWSPPWWMKYVGGVGCGPCGTWGPGNTNINWNTLIQKEIPSAEVPNDYKQVFADRLVAYVKIVKEQTGEDIYAISVQNEPAFSQTYPSAVYTDFQLRNLIKVVGERFEQEGLNTKIFGPEDVTWNTRMTAYMNAIGEDPIASKYTDIFAFHGYKEDGSTASDSIAESWMEISDTANKYNKPVWMTETSGFDHNLQNMMNFAKSINNALKYGKVEAYVYWSLLHGDVNKQKESLLTFITGEPSGLSSVMTQYARFARPGAVQVKSESSNNDLLVTSFTHPESGQQTTVIVNPGANVMNITLKVEGGNVPSSFSVYRTTAAERVDELGTFHIADTLLMPAQSIVTLVGNTGTADEPQPPTFDVQPVSATVSPESAVTLRVQAVGTPFITYQWYKDGVEIPNVIGNQLSVRSFEQTDAGTYTVKATSPFGSVESDPAVLSMGEFTGFKIEKTSKAPVIGNFDNTIWANAHSFELSKHIAIYGGQDNVTAADHSGSVKALWDDANLYLLYDIKDDILISASGSETTLDDVELFLDRDNSKNSTYGPGDFQFIFAYDDSVGVQETKHNATTGVTYQSTNHTGGYLIEAKIPWTTIGLVPSEGAYLGWDAASDDTDGYGRKSKVAWHTTNNDIWQYPNLMGVAMLTAGDSTPEPETSLEAYIGEDFDLTLGLSDVTQDFNTVELNIHYDPAKLTFATEPFGSPDHPEAMVLAEDAISIAPENPGLQIAGTVVLPDGTIHVIAMKTGGGMITAADKLFILHGTVKSGVAEGSTTVLLADAVITEGDDVSPVGGNAYAITLKTRVVVDTTALADLILTAQGALNSAVTGTLPGQYPAAAKTALQNAINQAQSVLGQTTADQDQINQAVSALQQALNVFNGSVNVGTLNKAALTAMINKAQAQYDSMEEGTKVTQYTSGAKAALQTAINQATLTLGSATSQQNLDDAVVALESAMQASGSQIITLVPGETQITIRELALLAKYYGMTREEANWGLYDTADIYGDGITIQVVAKVARLLLEDWLTQQ